MLMLVFHEPNLVRLHYVELVTDALIAPASLLLSISLMRLLRRPERNVRVFLAMFCTYLIAIGLYFLLRMFPDPPLWMTITEVILQEIAAMTGLAAAVILIVVLPRIVRIPDPNADGLTGLPNRMRFDERLEQALNTERIDPGYHFAVLFIDLDGFKLINDDLGHAAGDELLRTVAKRLRGIVRKHDLVARYGGDEFTVLLDRIPNLKYAENVATRLIERIQESYLINNQGLRVGASVGIVISSGKSNARQIIGNADQAMYRAKTARRGSYEVWNAVSLAQ
jgi:diguanylate cyclase (GGDEF)-like protein